MKKTTVSKILMIISIPFLLLLGGILLVSGPTHSLFVPTIIILVILVIIITYFLVTNDKKVLEQKRTYNEDFELPKEVVCQICGTTNNAKRTFCKQCQSNLRKIVCPVCRTLNEHNAHYCIECESILQNKRRHS